MTWPDDVSSWRTMRADFNPAEPRGKDGKWIGGMDLDWSGLASIERGWSDREDSMLAGIYTHRGDTGSHPISQGEFDSLGSGWTKVYRGVHATDKKQLGDYREQWFHGSHFAGEGIKGSGTYTTTAHDTAESYVGRSGVGELYSIAISPDAKVIDFKQAQSEMDKERPGWGESQAQVLEDEGRWAAWKGYDAIKVTRSDGSYWYIILNRDVTRTVR